MTDDIAHIATQLAAYLAPFAPFLVHMGESAAEEAGGRLGGEAWAGARRLWTRLRPAVTADPRASAAVVELSAAPDDGDLQAQFRVQVRRLLTEDEELASSLVRLMAEVASPTTSITGIDIRGDVYGGQQFGIVGTVQQEDKKRRPRG